MQSENTTKNYKAFLLLTLLIVTVYGNSFRAGWHFDDHDHILNNPSVRLTRLTLDSVVAAIHAAPRSDSSEPPRIFRPLVSLSFALNWYFGGARVFGYHLFNVGIHCLAAFFLYLSIACLYQTPQLKSNRDGQQRFVPLLATALWALSPIQTQAVTYIVQRMASMAAMFCILGLFLYLKGRLSKDNSTRLLYFSGVGIAFVCALASKENAIIFPLSLLLVEVVFFQSSGLTQIWKKMLIPGLIAILLIAGIGVMVILNGSPLSIFDAYEIRPYGWVERLMTQPRVLLFYLSEIFYPIAGRLSFEHDIFHSATLFQPWTTLPSIILVLSLVTLACVKIRRFPLLSFAILFFFLNHLIESSILPLELVFEHRNYMPSMFLFLPVAAGILRMFTYYRTKNSNMQYIVVGFTCLLIAGIGFSTYVRNLAWSTDMRLWQDALKKAPGSMRPYIQLAKIYQEMGDNDRALNLYQHAVDKYSERSKDYRTVILMNVGAIYFAEGRHEQAIEIWSDCIRNVKDYSGLHSNLVLAFARLKQWDNALEQLNHLLDKNPDEGQYNYLKGCYLVKTGRFEAGISHLRKALQSGYNFPKTLANIGVAYYLREDYRKAEYFFKWSTADRKKGPEILLWLLAVNLKLDDRVDSKNYAEQLMETIPISGLHSWLERISDKDHYLFPDRDQIFVCLKIAASHKFIQ